MHNPFVCSLPPCFFSLLEGVQQECCEPVGAGVVAPHHLVNAGPHVLVCHLPHPPPLLPAQRPAHPAHTSLTARSHSTYLYSAQAREKFNPSR